MGPKRQLSHDEGMWTSRSGVVVVALCAWCFAAACADGGAEVTAGEDASPAVDSSAPPAKADASAPKKDAAAAVDAASDDAFSADEPDAAPVLAARVFGHSPDTLYVLDVTSDSVSEIAPFSGCTQSTATQVIDLAIDSKMAAFATTFDGLYAVDLSTAKCTLIKAGSYPNSLSFVPAGTVDPNIEALVGYIGSSYVRINAATGMVSVIGALTGGYVSSGDIVSVEGGGTFLTVTGNGCADCLLQIDPKTGDMVQSYGALPHGAVYGLGYWGGTLYGFDATGDLFSISGGGDAGLVTTDVVSDGGVVWWGAGSTTAAPATSADGGAIATE